MGRVLLTLWFAVVALFGSRICCCPAVAASPVPASLAPVELACPCCVEESPCCDGTPGPLSPPKHDPCPCEKARLAMADLVPGPAQSLDWDGELRLGTLLAPALLDSEAPVPPVVVGASPHPEPPPLAGRALLASYSILRC